MFQRYVNLSVNLHYSIFVDMLNWQWLQVLSTSVSYWSLIMTPVIRSLYGNRSEDERTVQNSRETSGGRTEINLSAAKTYL